MIRDGPFRVCSRVLITYPRPYGAYQVRKPLKSCVKKPGIGDISADLDLDLEGGQNEEKEKGSKEENCFSS